MSSYFQFDGELRLQQRAVLTGEEARHVGLSRRLRPGDCFQLQDRAGQRFEVKLTKLERNQLEVEVLDSVPIPLASSTTLALWLALPKEKGLEFVLQKATELGVSRLVLFPGANSSGKAEAPSPTLQQRWQRILWEACKQSGRQFPPDWSWFPSLLEAVQAEGDEQQHWIFAPMKAPQGWPVWSESSSESAHALWIGPEGGWHESELTLAQQVGAQSLSLGPRILRAETAALAALSIFQHILGDLN